LPERFYLLPPIWNAVDEKICRGVHRLDRQPEIVSQPQQGHSIRAGTLDAHQIDIFRHASGIEPQGDQPATDQQPITLQAIGDRLDNGIYPREVELRGHDGKIKEVSPTWEALRRWGVPDGAIRPLPVGPLNASDLGRLVAELRDARFEALDPTMRECLLAWLCAFRHHWPIRFEELLGDVGRDAIVGLDDGAFDSNRYLKLRRIAVENLAGLV
jgi:hypothetical protein